MSQPSPQSRHRSTVRPGYLHATVLLAYLLLTAIMTWPLLLNLTSAIPGDGFDGWQNYWNQWWIKVALVDRIQNPLTTDILYYPTGVGLYFHTLNPFNGLMTLPVQLSAGLVVAYNAVVFISWVLGGYGMFLLTLWILGRDDRRTKSGEQRAARQSASPKSPTVDLRSLRIYFSAFAAGVIFTFSPFHMAHLLGHMQVMSFQWISFYVLYLLRGVAAVHDGRPWLRSSLMAAVFLIFTGLCDWYFVLYLLFFTLIALGWQGVKLFLTWTRGAHGNAAKPSFGRTVWTFARLCVPPAVAGILFAIVLSPWLAPMIRQSVEYSFMVRPQSDLYILSASVMDFLVPNRLHTLFRPESFSWIGNQIAPVSERTISIGYVTIGLAFVALFARRRSASFWAFTALLFFALALGPLVHLGNITWDQIPAGMEPELHLTPMGILNYFLPIARISRSISRFALMVQLSMAVLAGLGLATLLSRLRAQRSMAVVSALILAGILAEYWVAPYPLSTPDTPTYYTQVLAESDGDGAILNVPMNFDRPGYLLYQTVHQRPLTVAYISRDDPRTLTERLPVLQHFRHLGPDIIDIDPAVAGKTVLTDIGVEQVVLDRYKMPGGTERAYTTALANAIFAGESPAYEDERLTVYDVTPPEKSLPYVALGEENWGPLEVTDVAPLARRLTEKPANVHLLHVPDASQLRIRYRTAPEITVIVSSPVKDEIVSVLPPRIEAGEAVLDLVDLLDTRSGKESATVTLRSSGESGAWIERLELVAP